MAFCLAKLLEEIRLNLLQKSGKIPYVSQGDDSLSQIQESILGLPQITTSRLLYLCDTRTKERKPSILSRVFGHLWDLGLKCLMFRTNGNEAAFVQISKYLKIDLRSPSQPSVLQLCQVGLSLKYLVTAGSVSCQASTWFFGALEKSLCNYVFIVRHLVLLAKPLCYACSLTCGYLVICCGSYMFPFKVGFVGFLSRVQPWCAAIHAGQVLGVPSGRAELDWPPASRLLLLLLFLIPQVRSTLSVIGCLCRLLYLPRCAIYHLPLGLAPDFGSSLLPEVMSDSDSCPLHAPPC